MPSNEDLKPLPESLRSLMEHEHEEKITDLTPLDLDDVGNRDLLVLIFRKLEALEPLLRETATIGEVFGQFAGMMGGGIPPGFPSLTPTLTPGPEGPYSNIHDLGRNAND